MLHNVHAFSHLSLDQTRQPEFEQPFLVSSVCISPSETLDRRPGPVCKHPPAIASPDEPGDRQQESTSVGEEESEAEVGRELSDNWPSPEFTVGHVKLQTCQRQDFLPFYFQGQMARRGDPTAGEHFPSSATHFPWKNKEIFRKEKKI